MQDLNKNWRYSLVLKEIRRLGLKNIGELGSEGSPLKFASGIKYKGYESPAYDFEKHFAIKKHEGVVCLDVIEHLRNPREFLKNVAESQCSHLFISTVNPHYVKFWVQYSTGRVPEAFYGPSGWHLFQKDYWLLPGIKRREINLQLHTRVMSIPELVLLLKLEKFKTYFVDAPVFRSEFVLLSKKVT